MSDGTNFHNFPANQFVTEIIITGTVYSSGHLLLAIIHTGWRHITWH